MLDVREHIPSNLLATDEKNHIESFHVELNLHNEKWLINCSYNRNETDLQSSRFAEYIPGTAFYNIRKGFDFGEL